MKRLLLLLGMLVTCISIYATPVKLIGCTPADGSSVNEFNFTLTFDIADAISDLGGGEWGLGYTGNSTLRFAALYEGTKETGVELSKALTSNFTAKSDGFEVNNNSVTINFPNTIIPKKDQLYTLVISNNFGLYAPGKSIPNSASLLKFESEPLVYTFIGKGASSENLALQSISIIDNASLESIKEVKYTFNSSITVNKDIGALIKEDDITVAEAASMTVDGNVLVADFGNEVFLSYGHTYVLYLPESAVALATDPTKTNKDISINVNGTKTYTYSVMSVSPSDGDKILPNKVNILYSIPKGFNIVGGQNQWTDKSLKVYKSELSEDNLISTLNGSMVSNDTGLVWDLSNLSFEPSTEYILFREKGVGFLFDAENNKLPEWTNEETKIRFSTPSVEEANLPQIEFGIPVIGTHNKGTQFEDGMKLSSLFYLDVASKGEYKSFLVSPKAIEEDRKHGYLYEITDSGDVLVKEFNVGVVSIDDGYGRYTVGRFTVDATFYEGKKYRIVIPSGIYTAGSVNTFNYITNPELSYTVEGATPTEIKSKDCSIEEGATVSRLYNVTWTFNGNLNIKEDGCASMKITYANGTSANISLPLFRTSFSDTQTRIQAICTLMSTSDGNPIEFKDGWTGSITLPEGVLYAAADESIINKDIVVNFLGATPKPEAVAEVVDVEISYAGPLSSTTKALKGECITIKSPTDEWKIEKLMRYKGEEAGSDVTDFIENGVYTSSAINENTRFEAVLAYNGDIVFTGTNGVAELEDLDVRVFSDGESIMIEGLQGGEHITVYTVTGIVIGTHEAVDTYDTVNISAPKGQTYIVRIQRGDKTQAAKIMH